MLSGTINGRARKSLGHQLDRLDGILNGLAEALNESVAEAVKVAVEAAVREAVAAAVAEMLSRPELLRAVQASPMDASVKQANGGPGGLRRAWNRVAAAAAKLGQHCARAVYHIRQGLVRRAMSLFASLIAAWSVARACRAAAPIATLAGAVAGAACYIAGPVVAAAIGGLATGAMTLVAVTISRLKRQTQSGLGCAA